MSDDLITRANSARDLLLSGDSLHGLIGEFPLADTAGPELIRLAFSLPSDLSFAKDDRQVSLRLDSENAVRSMLLNPVDYWFEKAKWTIFDPGAVFLFQIRKSGTFGAVAHYLVGTTVCFVDVYTDDSANDPDLPLLRGQTAEVVLEVPSTPSTDPFTGLGKIHLSLVGNSSNLLVTRAQVVEHLLWTLRRPGAVLDLSCQTRQWYQLAAGQPARTPVPNSFNPTISWTSPTVAVTSVFAQLQHRPAPTCNVIPTVYSPQLDVNNPPSTVPMVAGQVVFKMW